MRKLMLLPLLVFVVVFVLAAAAPAGATDFKSSVTSTGFIPANQTIKNGDTVTWTNNDKVNHQVVANDGSFSSPVLAPGASYSHVFLDGGTFAYHDGSHPADHGTITVNATRFVLLRQTTAAKLTFTRSTMLKGVVSDGTSSGETVDVQAKPFGSSDFTTVATPTTTGGAWQALVRPRVNTVYRAVWNNVPSNEKRVSVRPLMKLQPTTHNRLSLQVSAGANLVGHHVTIQRHTRRGWVAFRAVLLRRLKANTTTYVAIARFHIRRGLLVRARMTRGQAGPAMYGPATSNSLRVLH
jgi:plastocyanin